MIETGFDLERQGQGVCRLGELFVQHPQHVGRQCPDVAFLLDPVASGTPGDLVDFRGGQRPLVFSVEFVGTGEQNRFDRQVQAHGDGIGGDEHFGFALAEASRLFAAYFGRKVAVDDADAEMA